MAVGVKEHLGVEVRSVSSIEIKKYNLDNKQGVVITRVDPKGPLGMQEFEVGDIILGIDNQPIESLESFVDLAITLHRSRRSPCWQSITAPGISAMPRSSFNSMAGSDTTWS